MANQSADNTATGGSSSDNGGSAETITDIQRLRQNYGCTCGQCIDGFLSPRMRYTLEREAEKARFEIFDEMFDYNIDIDNGDDFVREKILWESEVFFYMRECLRSGKAPRKVNLIPIAESQTKRYVELRGGPSGIFEHILRVLFNRAKDVHGRQVFGEAPISVECHNDDKYDMVAEACGLPSP